MMIDDDGPVVPAVDDEPAITALLRRLITDSELFGAHRLGTFTD
jgi:hypothetical protein